MMTDANGYATTTSYDDAKNALSHAWIDGHALQTHRHAPNTGSRKSWAAGDAARWVVWLALLALRGEMGYPSALSAPRWGFSDVLFGGRPLRRQTAVCILRDRTHSLQKESRRVPRPHRRRVRACASSTGQPLHRADRTERHYHLGFGDTHHPKRSIANAVPIFFTGGTATEQVRIEYPLGHRHRREEGLPLLMRKAAQNLAPHLPAERCTTILDLFAGQKRLEHMPVPSFMELFVLATEPPQ